MTAFIINEPTYSKTGEKDKMKNRFLKYYIISFIRCFVFVSIVRLIDYRTMKEYSLIYWLMINVVASLIISSISFLANMR